MEGWEFLVVAVVIVLLFGANRLPKIARSLGEARTEFEKLRRDAMGDAPDEDAVKALPPAPDTGVTDAAAAGPPSADTSTPPAAFAGPDVTPIAPPPPPPPTPPPPTPPPPPPPGAAAPVGRAARSDARLSPPLPPPGA